MLDVYTPLDGETIQRTATAAPETWNPKTLTVDVIAATENAVQRRDAAGVYDERLTMATLDLRAVDVPVYDSHRGGTARDVIGIVEGYRIEGGNLLATLRLSQAEDVAPVVARVAEGTLTGVSIGYAVAAWTESVVDGVRVKTPKAWGLREISLTPNPADPASRVRHQSTPPVTVPVGSIQNSTEQTQNGGAAMPDPVLETTTTPEVAERTRRTEIRTIVRTAGLPAETADDLIDQNATLDQAKAAAFDATQTRTAPVIRTHTAQNDDPAVIVRRQSDALAVRMAGGDCPAEAQQYLGESMLDLARTSLARSGVATRGMNADDVLTRAAHGTSDFPLVVSNAMGKVALDAYKAAECPIKTLCRQRILPNFKDSTSIRLGEMGRLEEIAESGEITHTSRAENGETMALKTYARGLNVSRNLLINDDMNLLGDMTSAFGEAAAQTEADILVELVTGNPNLSDGTAVFDASRGNLSGSGVALGSVGSESALDEARKAMRRIKGLDGKTLISATPKYLLVGPDLETAAEKLLATIQPNNTGDVNPFGGKLTLLVEPRITDDSWYVFADPARLPSLVYGYLAAAQGVQIQRTEAWDTLGLKYRAFLDFGAGWTDWRGAYLNEGDS
ncbi:Mu-like prophage major head subunit gpT family protein [Octadecabacter sp. G9-8]|uniref:Mu-like prophage major head subunit gpT family protein n=1 Tax=Octadecabacter dasysiphoniae TaxID=2909341 RepID=A0ABS9CTZ0_9RHOB|nr:prohead protease/major capsid protein fusion protein [Octadecabacter dasysiphoniae]MCF2870309.1 Mu-like prophage major head subunit gpT family protein [Octadecabacter dasysiphoniae]